MNEKTGINHERDYQKIGALWEGFAINSVWRSVGKADEHAYFLATHNEPNIDLFWQHDGQNCVCRFRNADSAKKEDQRSFKIPNTSEFLM